MHTGHQTYIELNNLFSGQVSTAKFLKKTVSTNTKITQAHRLLLFRSVNGSYQSRLPLLSFLWKKNLNCAVYNDPIAPVFSELIFCFHELSCKTATH